MFKCRFPVPSFQIWGPRPPFLTFWIHPCQGCKKNEYNKHLLIGIQQWRLDSEDLDDEPLDAAEGEGSVQYDLLEVPDLTVCMFVH